MIRLVREDELRAALAGSNELVKSREHVLTELAALRDWLKVVEANDQARSLSGLGLDPEFVDALFADALVGERTLDMRYPRELLEEIEREIKRWPKPLTKADL